MSLLSWIPAQKNKMWSMTLGERIFVEDLPDAAEQPSAFYGKMRFMEGWLVVQAKDGSLYDFPDLDDVEETWRDALRALYEKSGHDRSYEGLPMGLMRPEQFGMLLATTDERADAVEDGDEVDKKDEVNTALKWAFFMSALFIAAIILLIVFTSTDPVETAASSADGVLDVIRSRPTATPTLVPTPAVLQ